jgi:hypothetical protein
MPRTINIEVHKFNELTEEQQQKAIEFYRDKNYQHLFDDIDGEMMQEDFQETLKEEGKYPKGAKVYFSLSHCQGDGVCVHYDDRLDTSELMVLAERLMEEDVFKAYKELIEKYDVSLTGTVKHSGRYYHKYMMDVELEAEGLDYDDELSENETLQEKIIHLTEHLQHLILEDLREFCDKFEDSGYKEIEYHHSDEYIKELLIENEKEFELNEDGSIYKIWG